ncbi:MAG: hypothetical protein DRR08_02755 [Candidatus Parabeggiatoa sp. nov. 2]|nr:MAG: hypothetical protein B6247_07310 [Beggiatoa sp. 4572_84]RKZ63661.1 MAG: hypothetical protein DRR08_02755 [Gammaproteobacteria bacterium]
MNLVDEETVSITFPVDNVALAKRRLSECPIKEVLGDVIGSTIEACSGAKEQVVVEWSQPLKTVGYHPLIAAAFMAFSEHRPLVLSPDMVWITIAQGLAQHINLHPEKFRYFCVSHEAKLQIEVQTLRKDWAKIVHSFGNQIKRHTNAGLYELFVANFSTTGEIERTVSEVVMMDAFKRYFDYLVTDICGIPSVTLEGTTKDWILLKNKVEAIKLFGLKWWMKQLLAICDQFIRASQGDVDLEHWQNLCKLKDRYGEPIINGWIIKLIAYVRRTHNGDFNVINPVFMGKDEVTSWNLSNGLSIVPFIWKDRETKTSKLLELIAGFTGITQSPDNFALRPKLGWAVREVSLLDQLIHKIKCDHDSNRPYSGNFDKFRRFPSDLWKFYRATNGAGFYPSDKGYRYRILRLEEIEPIPGFFEPFFKLCQLEDGRFFAISLYGSVDKKRGHVYPIICYQRNLPESKRKVIAHSFTELLEYIINDNGDHI